MLNIIIYAINKVSDLLSASEILPFCPLKMLLKALQDDLTISVACFPYSRDASSEYC